MKMNSNRISSLMTSNEFDFFDFINSKVEFNVFPFDIHTGFVNRTEKGTIFNGIVDDYSQFERIFTGHEAVLARWTGSTGTYVGSDGKTIYKEFLPGRSIKFYISNTDTIDSVSNLQEDTNFLVERIEKTVTAYSTAQLNAEDQLKLYIINLGDEKLYYIDDIKEYFNPNNNDFMYSEFTFKSINDKIQNTGVAINQYVQYAAPGEGYAYPIEVDIMSPEEVKNNIDSGKIYVYDNAFDIPVPNLPETHFYVKNFENSIGVSKINSVDGKGTYELISNEYGYGLDPAKLANRPITSFQIEVQGKGILSDVYFYGRPVQNINNGNRESLLESRRLLLNEPRQYDSTQRDATQPYARNTTYKLIMKSNLVIESWYQSWKNQRDTQMNPATQKEYLGGLEIFYGSADKTSTVNPWVRTIIDAATIDLTELIWPSTVELKDKGTVKTLKFDRGTASTSRGNIDLPRLFTYNTLKNSIAPRLPLSYKESVPMTPTEVPLIGGLLNKLQLGIGHGWRNSTHTAGKNYNVCGLIPSDLLDFYQNAMFAPQVDLARGSETKNQTYSFIPLDDLQSDSSPDTTSKTDYTTILHYTLTDAFETRAIDPSNNKAYNTVDFGKVDKNGHLIAEWDINESYPIEKWSGIDGYAIDLWGMHFLGDADVKMTFYSGYEAVYTTKVKTLSNLTGSVRDWNSNYKLSNWSAPANTSFELKAGTSYYHAKTRDFEITQKAADDANKATTRIRDGIPVVLNQIDNNGDLILDGNGDPIPVYDKNGMIQHINVDSYLDRSNAQVPDMHKPVSAPSKIPEQPIFTNENIYHIDKGSSSSTIPFGTVFDKNIKDVLEANKYTDDYMLNFKNVSMDFRLYVRGDRSPFFERIEASASATTETLTFKIIKSGSSYTLKMAETSVPIEHYLGAEGKLTKLFSGVDRDKAKILVRITVGETGQIKLENVKANNKERPHEINLKMLNVKVDNDDLL